jgi:hypothetical protein
MGSRRFQRFFPPVSVIVLKRLKCVGGVCLHSQQCSCLSSASWPSWICAGDLDGERARADGVQQRAREVVRDEAAHVRRQRELQYSIRSAGLKDPAGIIRLFGIESRAVCFDLPEVIFPLLLALLLQCKR